MQRNVNLAVQGDELLLLRSMHSVSFRKATCLCQKWSVMKRESALKMFSRVGLRVKLPTIQRGENCFSPLKNSQFMDAWGWCTGKTQRVGMGREEGGGFRTGNTCGGFIFIYGKINTA